MVTMTKAPAFLPFELKDINTTHRLVIDVSKPNVLSCSKLGGSFFILKDKKKWLEVMTTEIETTALVNMLREAIKITMQKGRGGYVVQTNYPVKFIKPS